MRLSTAESSIGGAVIASISLCVACFAAWATHIIWIIKALASASGATGGQMVLGVLGAFMPPIGIIHGLILWFS